MFTHIENICFTATSWLIHQNDYFLDLEYPEDKEFKECVTTYAVTYNVAFSQKKKNRYKMEMIVLLLLVG
jgi:ribonuclease PH